ncbi:MAG: YafY family protein [Roseiflexaceae bacterium]|nr:YafY family protein [Roseiflexaceae bacterium]
MNRTDRLLAIVLELQARGQQRAEDLAATFEVSKRTIYRDVLALCEAGVPVISTPGQGYALSEGYFLPPLRFTPDEAVMLLLGSDVMAQSFDAEYRTAAESAARKIAGALPQPTRSEVQQLQAGLRFVENSRAGEPEHLRTIRRAIVAHRTIRFSYMARQGADGPSTTSVRDADPHGLARINEIWYLIAYCHLRRDVRNFRLSRISNIRVLSNTFERPEAFVLAPNNQGRDIEVRLFFDTEAAPWVREARFYYVSQIEEQPDGLLVILHVRRIDEVLQWVLGWGRQVRVLAPVSLRELVVEEITAMLKQAKTLLP